MSPKDSVICCLVVLEGHATALRPGGAEDATYAGLLHRILSLSFPDCFVSPFPCQLSNGTRGSCTAEQTRQSPEYDFDALGFISKASSDTPAHRIGPWRRSHSLLTVVPPTVKKQNTEPAAVAFFRPPATTTMGGGAAIDTAGAANAALYKGRTTPAVIMISLVAGCGGLL